MYYYFFSLGKRTTLSLDCQGDYIKKKKPQDLPLESFTTHKSLLPLFFILPGFHAGFRFLVALSALSLAVPV